MKALQTIFAILQSAVIAIHEKGFLRKKGAVRKTLTYLMGGNPNAEDALDLVKHEGVLEENHAVLEEFEKLLDDEDK